MENNRILLNADQMPRAWYNIAADIKEHLVPPLNFDMSSYESFMDGKLQDYEYPQEAIDNSMKNLPKIGYPE